MRYKTVERLAAAHKQAALMIGLSKRAEGGWRLLARMLLGAACLIAATTHVIAAEKITLEPRCAAKDLEVVTLIEMYGDAQEMSAEVREDVFSVIAKARLICATGQVQDALDLYENLGLGRVQSARAQ